MEEKKIQPPKVEPKIQQNLYRITKLFLAIMTCRLEKALLNRLVFLLVGIAVFVIASPILFMMGVAGLIYETHVMKLG